MIAGLGYPLSSWYAVLCGLGLLWLGLSKPRVAAVLLSPAVATFAAAVARQYPFSDRLIMFLLPVVCAGMAVAIVEAGRLASRGAHFVGALVLLALAVPPLVPVAARLPPYRLEEMKPVLSYISSRRNPNDAMYIYYAAAPALSIYDRSFAIGRNNYVVGGCHQGDTRRYLEELDTFRGQARIWIIFSHLLPVNPESEDIKGYLDAIGHRVDYVRADSRMAVDRNPPRVEAALYDLSDAARLGGAEARTFRVTERRKANERSCTNGPQVMIPSDFDCRAGYPCERRAKK
jgi:hypothetical protein